MWSLSDIKYAGYLLELEEEDGQEISDIFGKKEHIYRALERHTLQAETAGEEQLRVNFSCTPSLPTGHYCYEKVREYKSSTRHALYPPEIPR